MKNKAYLKKVGNYRGFKVWIVNGYFIRKHLNREFTNYGQHYRFEFIPEDEFWIDSGHSKKEINYFVKYLLIENQLMSRGLSYNRAVNHANKLERSERHKSKSVQKLKAELNKEKVISRVHKRFLKKYSSGIEVWLVHGDLVRSLFYIDFTQGGHDLVYNFIPKKEVWIDDVLYHKEFPYVIFHELYERHLMSKYKKKFRNLKKLYLWAHEKASEQEYFLRHNPARLKRRLKLEIRRNLA